jgi:Mor family transcriptional regulator
MATMESKDWRSCVTPLLAEMADQAAEVLRESFGMDEATADHAGYLVMRRWAETVGGSGVYIPTIDSLARHERDEAIWRDFTGDNIHELARRYGITTIHVYRIIKRKRAEERARRQHAMPI